MDGIVKTRRETTEFSLLNEKSHVSKSLCVNLLSAAHFNKILGDLHHLLFVEVINCVSFPYDR